MITQPELAELIKTGYASGIEEGKLFYHSLCKSCCPLAAASIGKIGRAKIDEMHMLLVTDLALVLDIELDLASRISDDHYLGKKSLQQILTELTENIYDYS